MVGGPIACLMGAVEFGLVMALREAKEKGLDWPSIVVAVAAAALLAAGVLRHYIDVYIYRSVRGISFIFVGIDALGDVFSLVSVLFQTKLDVLGMAVYGTELLLWTGIFICGAHYNLRPWVRAQCVSRRQNQPSSRGIAERDGTEVVASGIALHDLPSSTSVFRTPSGSLGIARRGGT